MDLEAAYGLLSANGSGGRCQVLLFLSIASTQLMMALQMCLMVPLGPLLLDKDNGSWFFESTTEKDMASSIYMFGVMLGNIIIGPITDKFGRRKPYFALVPLRTLIQGAFYS